RRRAARPARARQHPLHHHRARDHGVVKGFLAGVILGMAALLAQAAELRPWDGGATPPLALDDIAGKRHDLADYKGSVVLVNFWATWCEPCRAEMPSLDRLRKSLQGKRFEVLAVNLAEPLSRIEKFAERVPVSFPLLRDRDSSTSKAWKAKLLPRSEEHTS